MSIKVDLKIFLFLLLFLITSQIESYVILMTFACIHELGHLIMGIFLRFKPQEIKITPIGLQISFKIKCEEYNQKIIKGNKLCIKKAILASAGPITNFLIVFLIIFIKKFEIISMSSLVYYNIIYSNILIGLFNLIPIYPLDGGRIINEILHIIFGLRKSYTYTHNISKATIILLTVVSSIVILYIHNIAIPIILVYLWCLVIKENRIYEAKEQIYVIEAKLKNAVNDF